jgi:hypothetical protein
MKTFLTIGLLILPLLGICQIGSSSAGARALSMGEASGALSDVYSAGNNPAGMTSVDQVSVGFSALSYYGFTDLANVWLVAVVPTGNGAWGTSVQYFGDPTFNQAKAGISYALQLSGQFSIGAQLNYCHTRLAELGTGSAVTFDAGIQYKPIEDLTASARVFNPVKVSPGNDFSNEQLPALLSIGLAYQPSDKLLLTFEAEQDLYNEMGFKAGVEVPLLDKLFLRGGYISRGNILTTGFGIAWTNWRFDAAGQFHPQLGFSPAVAAQFLF